MSEEPPHEEKGLSNEELAAEEATELPARQAMSSIGDVSIPFDPHVAAETLLDGDQGEGAGQGSDPVVAPGDPDADG